MSAGANLNSGLRENAVADAARERRFSESAGVMKTLSWPQTGQQLARLPQIRLFACFNLPFVISDSGGAETCERSGQVSKIMRNVKGAAGRLCLGAIIAASVAILPGMALEAEENIVLTPEEKAEKESRKACKIEICDIFRSRKTHGDKIACHIRKSWREKAIKEMVTGGKIGWRWGKVRCNFDLNLSQGELQKAVVESEYTLKILPHTINCKVDRKKNGETYDISVGIAPEVKFHDGKAVEGRMNWGEIKAPLLVKGLIWPGVKLDNKLNVIGGKMVKMVNGFMTRKCDQVADELPSLKK
jgi:hypothetical protein